MPPLPSQSYLHSNLKTAKQLQPEHVYVQHSGAVKLDIMDMKVMLADYKCVPCASTANLVPSAPSALVSTAASSLNSQPLSNYIYHSPHFFDGNKADEREDIYGLGMLCLEVSS
jgi:hypothetical protein